MRAASGARLAFTLIACVGAARAAEAPAGRLGEADRALAAVEKSLDGAPPPATDAEVVADCVSSFSMPGMTAAVARWTAIRSPIRSALPTSSQLSEFSRDTSRRVSELLLAYDRCVSISEGRPRCEDAAAYERLTPMPGLERSCRDAAGIQLAHDAFFDAARRRAPEAQRRCLEWRSALGGFYVFRFQPLDEETVCRTLVERFDDPGAVCAALAERVDSGEAPCTALWAAFAGLDCSGAEGVEGGLAEVCARHKAALAGTPRSGSRRCAAPFQAARAWYCGRYQRPELASFAAPARRSLGEARRRARALARVSAVERSLAAAQAGSMRDPAARARLAELRGRAGALKERLGGAEAP